MQLRKGTVGNVDFEMRENDLPGVINLHLLQYADTSERRHHG